MLHLARRLAFSLALLAPCVASADLIAPGTRPVSYTFEVTNLEAFPDWVIVAFPWSLSDGAPTEEATVVKPGKPVDLGRRSDTPVLYAVKKTDYEAFVAKNPSSPSRHEWKEMRAFVASAQAVKCDAKLSPVFSVDEDSPVKSVNERFRADKIDETTCSMTGVGAPPVSTSDQAANQPAGDAPSDPSAPAGSATPAGAGGCAGCTVATARKRAGYAGTALGAGLGVVFLMRRSKRKPAKSRRR